MSRGRVRMVAGVLALTGCPRRPGVPAGRGAAARPPRRPTCRPPASSTCRGRRPPPPRSGRSGWPCRPPSPGPTPRRSSRSTCPRTPPRPSGRRRSRRNYPPVAPVSAALPAEGRPLSLAELQAFALANNPAIRRARADAEAAYGTVIQQGLHPNPTVGYQVDQWQPGLFTPPGSTSSGKGQQGGFVNQLVKTAGKLRLQQLVAGVRLPETPWVAVRRAEVDVTAAVRSAYFGALVARQGVEVYAALAAPGRRGVPAATEAGGGGRGGRVRAAPVARPGGDRPQRGGPGGGPVPGELAATGGGAGPARPAAGGAARPGRRAAAGAGRRRRPGPRPGGPHGRADRPQQPGPGADQPGPPEAGADPRPPDQHLPAVRQPGPELPVRPAARGATAGQRPQPGEHPPGPGPDRAVGREPAERAERPGRPAGRPAEPAGGQPGGGGRPPRPGHPRPDPGPTGRSCGPTTCCRTRCSSATWCSPSCCCPPRSRRTCRRWPPSGRGWWTWPRSASSTTCTRPTWGRPRRRLPPRPEPVGRRVGPVAVRQVAGQPPHQAVVRPESRAASSRAAHSTSSATPSPARIASSVANASSRRPWVASTSPEQ